jgi:PBSX family phage terminase large subunit
MMPKYKPLTGKNLQAATLSTAFINVFEGSVRSGKTIGTLFDWAKFCAVGPPGVCMMAGRTERTIINNLILPLQEMFGPNLVTINRGNGTVNILGREVILVGANNELARTKIQGATLVGGYLDEIATLPESFVDMFITRLSEPGAKMWATCNPEGPRHWFKLKWLDKAKLWLDHDGELHHRNPGDYDDDDDAKPLDLHRFSFILDDNEHLGTDYVARIKASFSGLFYQRMVRGMWALADGAVYDMFTEAKHVIAHDDMPHMSRILALGIDHGMTNATAGILLGLGVDGHLYAMDEWSPPPKGLSIGEQADSLRDWLADRTTPEWIYVDPAAKAFKVEIKKAQIGRSTDATNEVEDNINTIGALFSSGNLFISDRCTHLRDEIPGYVWDPKKTDKGEDAVIKLDDHYLDAFRYAIASTEKLWRRTIRSLIKVKTTARAQSANAAKEAAANASTAA